MCVLVCALQMLATADTEEVQPTSTPASLAVWFWSLVVSEVLWRVCVSLSFARSSLYSPRVTDVAIVFGVLAPVHLDTEVQPTSATASRGHEVH
jgi:hypothetical protein